MSRTKKVLVFELEEQMHYVRLNWDYSSKKWELTPKLGWLCLIGFGLFFDLKYIHIYRVSENSYVIMDRHGTDVISRSDLNNTCVYLEVSKTGMTVNVSSDFDENLK